GLRQRNDLLAAISGVAEEGGLEQDPLRALEAIARGRPDQLVARGRRLHIGPRCFWGDQTGPNPTDRRKAGSKHHVVTDGNGIPLVARVTAANANDVTQLLLLIDAIPSVGGKPGAPKRRPERAYADRAYDSEPHRK